LIKYAAKAFNWAKRSPGGVLGNGIGIYFGMDTYQEARESGDSKFIAAGQAVGEFAMASFMGFLPYVAFEAVTSAPSLAMNAIHEAGIKGRKMQVENSNRAFQNSTFSDTEQIYTMRQAGMAIAQRSRYNTQQAMLGNEAKYMMK